MVFYRNGDGDGDFGYIPGNVEENPRNIKKLINTTHYYFYYLYYNHSTKEDTHEWSDGAGLRSTNGGNTYSGKNATTIRRERSAIQ